MNNEYNSNLIKNWANKSYRKRNEILELTSLNKLGIEIKYIEDMYSCGISIRKDDFTYGYTLADIDGERNQDEEYEKMLKVIYFDVFSL